MAPPEVDEVPWYSPVEEDNDGENEEGEEEADPRPRPPAPAPMARANNRSQNRAIRRNTDGAPLGIGRQRVKHARSRPVAADAIIIVD